MRRAAKVDRNQAEIVSALRDVGATVQPLDVFGIDTSNNAYRGAGARKCRQCGAAFHSYSARKFCGTACYARSRISLADIRCARCGNTFHPRTAGMKYCSQECVKADRSVGPGYVPHPRPHHITDCAACGHAFRSPPSQGRKYCSYRCFQRDGGSRRAGEAAVIAMKKYGAKKDANHSLIFGLISALVPARDLSAAGFGIPDGIAWVAGGWHLFDIKNPKSGYGRRGLNPRQKRWADDWRGGPVFLIYTEQDAKAFCRGDFGDVKRFGGESVSAVYDLHMRGDIA